ncbi:MAG: hypothetical protein PHC88_03330 [Terrimicrobiaceae bacterium]|nr:hypothetical protein [Terrimicrobiaceae bacterium]
MIPAFILFAVAVLYRVVLGFTAGGDSWLPNFAPVAAIALCAPSLFPRRIALALPLAILLASDIMLNWHFGVALATGEMFARYFALLAIALVGLRLSASKRVGSFLLASVAGSTGFYVVTNTVSWLAAPEYAKTDTGWWQALTLGVPGYPPTWMFFRNSLASDVVFTLLFVGCFALGRRFTSNSMSTPEQPLRPCRLRVSKSI